MDVMRENLNSNTNAGMQMNAGFLSFVLASFVDSLVHTWEEALVILVSINHVK